MDFDLSPKGAQAVFDGEGGSYYSWSSSEFPLLAEANVGAGKLVLQPQGFALPHYADSSKVGYVLEGTGGLVGIVLPNSSEEVIVRLKKGDTMPVPLGSVSWWYNDGNSEFVIVFLGETSKAYVPGEFTYFLLSGGLGYMSGFSTEFISRAYKLNQDEANKLAKSQAGVLIIKLEAGQSLPQACKESADKVVYNIDALSPDVDVEKGGKLKMLTAAEFPLLKEAGLSLSLVKVDSHAMFSPTYTADGSAQLFYVAKGSGRVQIVGSSGKRVLDSRIEAGQLLAVPRFFVVSKIAGSEGMELFSILTTTRPVVENLASKKSVWSALSPAVTQVALGVPQEFEEFFKCNIRESSILIPPPKSN